MKDKLFILMKIYRLCLENLIPINYAVWKILLILEMFNVLSYTYFTTNIQLNDD